MRKRHLRIFSKMTCKLTWILFNQTRPTKMSYKENPTNAGRRWSAEEQSDFEKEIASGMSMNDIVFLHKRSHKSIFCRTLMLAAKDVVDDEISIEQASQQYDLNPTDLARYIEEKKSKSTFTGLASLNEKIDMLIRKMNMLEEDVHVLRSKILEDFVVKIENPESSLKNSTNCNQ